MTRVWTVEEDMRLLRFKAGPGRTLRALAEELGRTYYACRTRRKLLTSEKIRPGQAMLPRKCRGCQAPLPPGRPRYCESCRKRALLKSYRMRYRSGSLATIGAAHNRFARWSDEDDQVLMSGKVTISLARRLGRTLKSCYARRERLAKTLAVQ